MHAVSLSGSAFITQDFLLDLCESFVGYNTVFIFRSRNRFTFDLFDFICL